MSGTAPQDLRTQKTATARASRRFRLSLFTLVVALPVLLLGQRCRLIAKATCILYAIGTRKQPALVKGYLWAFASPVAAQDVDIPGETGPIAATIYSPGNSPKAPLIVLIPGMNSRGFRDPYLKILATRMAAMGLAVVTPDIVSEHQFLMRREAVVNIGDAVLWASAKQQRPVPLIGISFSGGLVLAAASQPAYASHVSSVFCISGYNDILRLGNFYIHNGESAPDGAPAIDDNPKSPGRLYMAVQYMGEMVPPADVAAMQRLTAEYLDRQNAQAEKDLASLSPAQRDLFLDLNHANSPAMKERFVLLMKNHAQELEGISPRTQLKNLKAPVYLLHGTHDDVVPMAEAEWNIHDMPAGVPIHPFFSPWMRHALLNVGVSPWEKLRLANYVATVLYAFGLR